jgi:hypothetical protein
MQRTNTVWLALVALYISSSYYYVQSFTIIQPHTLMRTCHHKPKYQPFRNINIFAEEKPNEATTTTTTTSDAEDVDEDDVLDKVELMGKGAAKVRENLNYFRLY